MAYAAPGATASLESIDKALLSEIQERFPLEHRPFAILGQLLGLSESACLARTERLKTRGILWQIAAQFDGKRLGYQRCLVAMKVDPLRLGDLAAVVGRHPGITQSDRRDDPFNLWLSIAVPASDSLVKTVQVLHRQAESADTLFFPVLKTYKTRAAAGPARPMTARARERDDASQDEAAWRDAPRPALTESDIAWVRIVQQELPLLEMPYAVWAEQAGVDEATLFAWLRRMGQIGYLSRIGAMLHPDAGMTANVLVVWHVPEEDVDRIGEETARFLQVSQCDRRPVYPNWPYALFTKIHARTVEDCLKAASRIQDHLGPYSRKPLLSLAEHKRQPMRYFSVELDAWWKQAEAEDYITE